MLEAIHDKRKSVCPIMDGDVEMWGQPISFLEIMFLPPFGVVYNNNHAVFVVVCVCCFRLTLLRLPAVSGGCTGGWWPLSSCCC
jgi:hypothetical protein